MLTWIKAHWTVIAGTIGAALMYWQSHGGVAPVVGGVSLVGLITAALYSQIPGGPAK